MFKVFKLEFSMLSSYLIRTFSDGESSPRVGDQHALLEMSTLSSISTLSSLSSYRPWLVALLPV